jgi:hypothetical protein
MTLQTSGAIDLGQIQTEFGGANPISISEYYAGAGYVPSGTSGTNGAVPSSGTISFSSFYGTSAFISPMKGLAIWGAVGYNSWSATKVIISSTGSFAADVSVASTARMGHYGTNYGGDKGIYGFGQPLGGSFTRTTNLVDNAGNIGADVTNSGVAMIQRGACSFGSSGQAMFAFGQQGTTYNTTWLNSVAIVSSSGSLGAETTGAGTGRYRLSATRYSTDKGIFMYGTQSTNISSTVNVANLVSNTGVLGSDYTTAGSSRGETQAVTYGGDKAIIYGGVTGSAYTNVSNTITNTGVISSNITGVGTVRGYMAAMPYGGDKGVYAWGANGNTYYTKSNYISNTGTVGADSTSTGAGRTNAMGLGFSATA